MAELLKGAPIAKELYGDFLKRSDDFKERGIYPKLRIIIASDEPAIETYSSMIVKNCEKAGILSDTKNLSVGSADTDILGLISESNNDGSVHGIIVMLPLWKQLDEKKILAAISPEKDIDGVNPYNAGKTVLGQDSFTPNTAQACKDIILRSGIEFSGKHVVIIGRSNIVGKPLANMLLQKGVEGNLQDGRYTGGCYRFAKVYYERIY